MIAAAALVTGASLAPARAAEAAGALGAAGVLVLAAGVARRRGSFVTAGLALAGASFGVAVVGGGAAALTSPVAAALVLCAELAYWAIEPGAPVPLWGPATARRALFSVAVAVVSAGLATLLVAAAATPLDGGAALGVAGVAAFLAVAGIVMGLLLVLRRPAGDRPTGSRPID